MFLALQPDLPEIVGEIGPRMPHSGELQSHTQHTRPPRPIPLTHASLAHSLTPPRARVYAAYDAMVGATLLSCTEQSFAQVSEGFA